MPWPWALNGPGEDLRPDLLVRNAFRLLPSADRLYIKRRRQIFPLLEQEHNGLFPIQPSGVKIAASVNLFPLFPSALVLEKTCATCQDDMSLTFKHLFFFFFLWLKHVLFSLSGHFCAKKKKGKWTVLEECPWKVWTTQVARWSRRCNQLNNRTTKEQPRLR